LLKTEYLLGSFRNWHLFRQFRIGSAAGAIIGSGKTRVPFKKNALHNGETIQAGADKTGRAAFVGFAIILFANRFLFLPE